MPRCLPVLPTCWLPAQPHAVAPRQWGVCSLLSVQQRSLETALGWSWHVLHIRAGVPWAEIPKICCSLWKSFLKLPLTNSLYPISTLIQQTCEHRRALFMLVDFYAWQFCWGEKKIFLLPIFPIFPMFPLLILAPLWCETVPEVSLRWITVSPGWRSSALVTEGRIPRGSNKYRCGIISCIPKEPFCGHVKDAGDQLASLRVARINLNRNRSEVGHGPCGSWWVACPSCRFGKLTRWNICSKWKLYFSDVELTSSICEHSQRELALYCSYP